MGDSSGDAQWTLFDLNDELDNEKDIVMVAMTEIEELTIELEDTHVSETTTLITTRLNIHQDMTTFLNLNSKVGFILGFFIMITLSFAVGTFLAMNSGSTRICK